MMYRPNRALAVRRSLLALGFALMLGGCTTWAEAPSPSPSAGVITGPLRIVRNDGFSIVMEHVSVRGDSVVGHEQGHDDRLVAVALADVKRTERQDIDPARSLGTAFVGIAAGFGIYIYVVLTNLD